MRYKNQYILKFIFLLCLVSTCLVFSGCESRKSLLLNNSVYSLDSLPLIEPRESSISDPGRNRLGSEYYESLPHNRVIIPPSQLDVAVFQPYYINAGASSLDHLAYCIYVVNVSEYTGDGNIRLHWQNLLQNNTTAFVGLSDWQHDRWTWFASDREGKADAGSFSEYSAPNGAMLICVAVIGQDTQVLESIDVGSYIWGHTWGGSFNDYAMGVSFDTSGAVLVAGMTLPSGNDNIDCLLLKYSLQGNLQWSKTWGTDGNDLGTDVIYDEEYSTQYVCGMISGDRIFLLSIANNGELFCQKIIRSTEPIGTQSMIHMPSNKLKLVCYEGESGVMDTLIINMDTGLNIVSCKTWVDAFPYAGAKNNLNGITVVGSSIRQFVETEQLIVLQLNESDDLVWARTWRTPGIDDDIRGQNVCIDTSGNMYLSAVLLPESGVDQSIIMKLNSAGNLIWVNKIEISTSDIYPTAIIPQEAQGILLTCHITRGESEGIAILKIDPAGNLVWSRLLEGDTSEGISAIASNDLFALVGNRSDCNGYFIPLNLDYVAVDGVFSETNGSLLPTECSIEDAQGVLSEISGTQDGGAGDMDAFTLLYDPM